MFLKFTKLDGYAIWINAAFIVTVEPRKGGGSIVVPIGDGLDYDVRESPEKVLEMLQGAPTPSVVPVPTTDALTKSDIAVVEKVAKVEGVEKVAKVEGDAQPPEGEAKPKRTRKTKAKAEKVEKVEDVEKVEKEPQPSQPTQPSQPSQPELVEKPKKTRKTKAKKAKDEGVEKVEDVEKVEKEPQPSQPTQPVSQPVAEVELPPLFLDDTQVARLRKMVPGRIKALKNTLKSQFKIAAAYLDETIEAMVAHKIILLDGEKVIWQAV